MQKTIPILFVATMLGLAVSSSADAAEKPSAAKPATAPTPAAAEKGETVAYDDLRLHVGKKVIVHTRFKSTRVGTLTKFSQIELTLSIDTPDGAAELTIPKDTVANVVVVSPPAK